MEVRYSIDPSTCMMADSDELRSSLLLDDLFENDKVKLVYCEVDRAIVGAAVPVKKTLELVSSKKEMAAEYFLERREAGVINIGGKGTIICDGTEYELDHKDALYIGRGTKKVEFKSSVSSSPANFYIASFPAHKEYPTSLIKSADAVHQALGSVKDANKRVINKYILPGHVQSCQLVMGLTELDEGSVWNTMPVHTHQRRSEIYMYFNIGEDALVFHLLGEPDNTRHIVVRDRQAVISPSWSIHSGCGTRNYSFIWAMGGENQAFDDMDWVKMEDLK
ncbi:MAG: 5-dehydro-4-deoxy-D-glucuronate isomerase [Syntrophothermus sp.]